MISFLNRVKIPLKQSGSLVCVGAVQDDGKTYMTVWVQGQPGRTEWFPFVIDGPDEMQSVLNVLREHSHELGWKVT